MPVDRRRLARARHGVAAALEDASRSLEELRTEVRRVGDEVTALDEALRTAPTEQVRLAGAVRDAEATLATRQRDVTETRTEVEERDAALTGALVWSESGFSPGVPAARSSSPSSTSALRRGARGTDPVPSRRRTPP